MKHLFLFTLFFVNFAFSPISGMNNEEKEENNIIKPHKSKAIAKEGDYVSINETTNTALILNHGNDNGIPLTYYDLENNKPINSYTNPEYKFLGSIMNMKSGNLVFLYNPKTGLIYSYDFTNKDNEPEPLDYQIIGKEFYYLNSTANNIDNKVKVIGFLGETRKTKIILFDEKNKIASTLEFSRILRRLDFSPDGTRLIVSQMPLTEVDNQLIEVREEEYSKNSDQSNYRFFCFVYNIENLKEPLLIKTIETNDSWFNFRFHQKLNIFSNGFNLYTQNGELEKELCSRPERMIGFNDTYFVTTNNQTNKILLYLMKNRKVIGELEWKHNEMSIDLNASFVNEDILLHDVTTTECKKVCWYANKISEKHKEEEKGYLSRLRETCILN